MIRIDSIKLTRASTVVFAVSRWNLTFTDDGTVRSESRCALRLRYVDLVVSIDARGHHFHHVLQVHSEIPNADLQKVFANKIKRVQACINARGHHFQHLL
jgi:hypothetical protein